MTSQLVKSADTTLVKGRGMEEKPVRLRFQWLTDKRMTLLFLLPTMILLLMIAIFPLIWSLRLSFTDWSVIGDAGTAPVATGLENYKNILGLGESASQLRLGREVVDRFVITGQFVIPAVGVSKAPKYIGKFPTRPG